MFLCESYVKPMPILCQFYAKRPLRILTPPLLNNVQKTSKLVLGQISNCGIDKWFPHKWGVFFHQSSDSEKYESCFILYAPNIEVFIFLWIQYELVDNF